MGSVTNDRSCCRRGAGGDSEVGGAGELSEVQRATGSSTTDRQICSTDSGVLNLDQRMDDARAVMDAAGIERATIMGVSEGGSLAVLFAASSGSFGA